MENQSQPFKVESIPQLLEPLLVGWLVPETRSSQYRRYKNRQKIYFFTYLVSTSTSLAFLLPIDLCPVLYPHTAPVVS
jgi:hypothetical protein